MAFIDGNDPDVSVLIGPQSGAERLFRLRAKFNAGFFVGLHTHRGDESFEVLRGEVRFSVGGERRVCRPGMVVFVPRAVEHGFVALTDITLQVFSEQCMGLYVVVLEPDSTRRIEEIYIEGFPSSHEPPSGMSYTPPETIRRLYGTTWHLL